ncbi:MAG: hypothetical protein ACLUE0_06260 [Bacteroides uniformis]|jgi:hypothetical protein
MKARKQSFPMAAKQDGWQESVNTRKKAVNQERKNENNIIINH